MDKNIENYADVCKIIGDMYEVRKRAFESAMDEINSKFGYLLEEIDLEEDNVVSNIPKVTVDTKKKRMSRASKKYRSTSREVANLNETENQGRKKSLRIASKMKILPVSSSVTDTMKDEPAERFDTTKLEPIDETTVVQLPVEVKCEDETQETVKRITDEEKNDLFVIPETSRTKTVKEKREPRVSKRNALLNTTITISAENSNNRNVDDGCRKSSRITSKAKILPVSSSQELFEAVEVEPIEEINDEEKEDLFTVPEIPKIKTVEEKQESRVLRRNALLNTTLTISENSNNQNVDDGYGKCSSIARKAGLLPIVSPSPANSVIASGLNLCNDDVSKYWNLHRGTPLDDTVCTEDIQNPVSNSTPLASPSYEKSQIHETPTLVCDTECVEKPDSVKKMIEEFEKKAEKTLTPCKIPAKTPKKKNTLESVTSITRAKKGTTDGAPKSKLGKNAKALRERNINIKIPAIEEPKLDLKKATSEIKRKETRMVTAQREAEKKAISEMLKQNLEKQKVQSLEEETFSDLQYNIDRELENESSEDEDRPKNKIPSWATKEVRAHPLIVQSWLNKEKTVYPWFFTQKRHTPNLEDLFSNRVKMRPRTSSAVWNKSHFH